MSQVRPRRRRLAYDKCTYCRTSKKKCEPRTRDWPDQKCNRCLEKELPCSENYRIRKTRAVSDVRIDVSRSNANLVHGNEQTAQDRTGFDGYVEGRPNDHVTDLIAENRDDPTTLHQMGVYGHGTDGLPKDGNEVTMDLELLDTPQQSLGSTSTERVDITAASSPDPPESPTSSITMDSGQKWSELHEAACLGKDHMVKKLLDRGFDPNVQDEDGDTPLQMAAERDGLSCIKILLDYGADINCCSGRAGSALEIASWGGYEVVVRLLLEKGATDKDSALYEAALGGREPIVDMLIEARANARFKHSSGQTVLHSAAIGGNVGVLRRVLSAGGIEDINYQENNDLPTPLHLAAKSGRSDAFNLLLEHGANLHALGGPYHGSVIHAACDGGNASIVRLLLSKGVDYHQSGGNYSSPLHAACIQGHRAVVDVLLDHDVRITLENESHGNMLVVLFERGHFAIARRLMECGVDINVAAEQSHSLLCQASAQGNIDLVRLLLEKGVDLNSMLNPNTSNALHSAISSRQPECLRKYYGDEPTRNYDTNSKEWRRDYRKKYVLDDGHLAVAKLLINKGINIHQQSPDCDGGTPLHQVIRAYSELVRYEVDSEEVTSRGILREIMTLLLEKGAAVDAVNWFRATPLIYATMLRQSSLVQLLLQHGADTNPRDLYGMTALWRAAYKGQVDIVSYCLGKGADPTISGPGGWPPRDIAVRRGHDKGNKNVVKLLDDHER